MRTPLPTKNFCPQIHKVRKCLEVFNKIFLQNFFQEISNYWRKRISEEKFNWHNSQWLEMVKQTTTNEQLNNSEYDKLFEDEYILPSGLVLNSEELLRDSEFLNSVVAPIQRR